MEYLLSIGERGEKMRMKLQAAMPEIKQFLFDQTKNKNENNILIHGDCTAFNLMFKQEGEKCRAKLIDYQNCMWGDGLQDIAMLLIPSTNADFRRKHGQELMEKYRKSFRNYLGKLGVELNEEFKEDWENAEKLATFHCLLGCETWFYRAGVPERLLNILEDAESRGFF
jgi:aminoglycoside/choline kinase family phosphotransferase